jgi:hypothetical protein
VSSVLTPVTVQISLEICEALGIGDDGFAVEPREGRHRSMIMVDTQSTRSIFCFSVPIKKPMLRFLTNVDLHDGLGVILARDFHHKATRPSSPAALLRSLRCVRRPRLCLSSVGATSAVINSGKSFGVNRAGGSFKFANCCPECCPGTTRNRHWLVTNLKF